ncbi:MAG TPA: VWA domain-containing protein, partial [Thermoleophilia bacterium]|nr:VWA domain-containing protein [Thermoleophilia bacterium]
MGVSSLDLTAYPNASAGVHLGGTVAPTLGTLTKDAFSIQVDGTPLQIVSVEEASSGATLPVQTVLLIDESGSMSGAAIASAASAASRFVSAMGALDTAAIQAFNEGFRTLLPFSEDKSALTASLEELRPQKET